MILMALALAMLVAPVTAQTAPPSTSIASLELSEEKVSHLHAALAAHDYVAAESLLLKEIEQDPHSLRSGHLLAYAGSVYFLNQDYLKAAIAWKKAEAIAPLTPDLQFSQAMAYVRIHHPDWARPVLTSLAAHDDKNALYPYWLGRLAYDAHQYDQAIQFSERAIALDPGMSRAYDNLGLCYYARNENDRAVQAFERAITLEQKQAHPSPWPWLNLAATQQFLGRMPEAEHNLREAVRPDPGMAQAHFQLGVVLEHQNQLQVAVGEFKQAIALDAGFAEPHLALAHIYRQSGKKTEAEAEVTAYKQLHKGQN